MEDFFEEITRGNVTEVKVVLASVVMALACYQLFLIAVGYGKLRPRFLDARPASFAHRAAGDAIVVMVVVVALMCGNCCVTRTRWPGRSAGCGAGGGGGVAGGRTRPDFRSVPTCATAW